MIACHPPEKAAGTLECVASALRPDLLSALPRLDALAHEVVETPSLDALDSSVVLVDLLFELGIKLDPRRHDLPGAYWPNDTPEQLARTREWDRGWAVRWAFKWVYGAELVDCWMGLQLRSKPNREGNPHGQFVRMVVQRMEGTAPEQQKRPRKQARS
jgi:hypothetical protein